MEDALRRKLSEDLESTEGMEPLLPVIRRLEQWQAPAPDAADTLRLIETLRPLVPVPAGDSAARSHAAIVHRSAWLLRAQMKVVRREIWLASLLVMALGAAITLAFSTPTGGMVPFVLFAPIVAATGVAFIYGPLVDPAIEIELATPVSPRLVLLARLALVFGFDLLLGLIASAALAALRTDVSFRPLVTAWLAPMAFLSSLAFLLTMLTTSPVVGAAAGMVLWILQIMRQIPELMWALSRIPDWMAPPLYSGLLLTAALLVGLGLWIGGREERWIDGAA